MLLFLAVSPSPAPRRDDVLEERVQRWLEEAAGASRATPAWRDVERQIEAGFHPTLDEVTRESMPQTLIKQLLHAEPEPRPADGTPSTRAEEVEAARRAYQAPKNWKRVEIESEVDDKGNLLSLRVVFSSGQRELDRAALAAVRQAIERRPPRERHAIVRWAVEAGTAVRLPALGAMVDEHGRVSGAGVGLGLAFDESTGKLGVDVPFTRRIRTRVRLLSIRYPK